ncbi:MAG TPA: hypothetical protein VEW08_07315 [Steroidobacteraceae bacterium]|nr:hypothetical protein [Steroidobacteraceae bacterium]
MNIVDIAIAPGQHVSKTERHRMQAHALWEISASKYMLGGNVDAMARQITEMAAQATGVARANVWLFNDAEDELRCIDLYEARASRHSSGSVLREH